MRPDDTTDSVPQEELLALLIPIPFSQQEPEIVLTKREVVVFLSMSAAEYAATPCDDLHCEVCDEFVSSWKSIYGALDATHRGAVEDALESYNVRAPAYPKGLR